MPPNRGTYDSTTFQPGLFGTALTSRRLTGPTAHSRLYRPSVLLIPSVELRFRTETVTAVARPSRVDRQRRQSRSRLYAPVVVSPTPLPLADQRLIRVKLSARARTERTFRPARSVLRPNPPVVLIPSAELELRTIKTTYAWQTRLDQVRRAARSHTVWSPAAIQGSVLTVLRSPSSPSALSAPVTHPALVLIQTPPWRFVVTDRNTATVTFLDRLATGRSVVYTLNLAATATGTVDSTDPEINLTHTDGDPFLAEGDRLLYAFRREGGYDADGNYAPWRCRFAGPILQIDDTINGDQPKSTFTAFDAWQYLYARPVCFPDGTLPGNNGMTFTNKRGNQIALQLLKNTITNHGACGIDAGVSNGGTSFYGTYASLDATAKIDITFQQGCSVGEAWAQLAATNTIDLVLRPIYDPLNRPGYTAELGVHKTVGVQRDGAIFAWDLPSHSLLNIDRLQDGTQRANEVQFFTQGGFPVALQFDPTFLSQAKFGEWWALQTFSGDAPVSIVEWYAKAQVAMRKDRPTTIRIDPAPERSPVPFNEYNIGDTVPLYASKRLRQPISGTGRIYTIPIDITDDNVETIKQMEFSADALTLTTSPGGGVPAPVIVGGSGGSFTPVIIGDTDPGDTLTALVT